MMSESVCRCGHLRGIHGCGCCAECPCPGFVGAVEVSFSDTMPAERVPTPDEDQQRQQNTPDGVYREASLICVCGHPQQIHGAFSGQCGVCECPGYVSAAASIAPRPEQSPIFRLQEMIARDVNVALIKAEKQQEERRELWKAVAIAGSERWILPEQPVIIADAVLEAFDIRFCGKTPEVAEKPAKQVVIHPGDPVGEILGALGVKS